MLSKMMYLAEPEFFVYSRYVIISMYLSSS